MYFEKKYSACYFRDMCSLDAHVHVAFVALPWFQSRRPNFTCLRVTSDGIGFVDVQVIETRAAVWY